MKQAFKTMMVVTHSFLIHVPVEKYAQTYMVEKVTKYEGDTCTQGLPIPPEGLLQKYSVHKFLESGKENVSTMLDIINEGGYVWDEGQRVLDFGCASSRMIRWLLPYTKNCEIWGVDINAKNLIWCQQFLSPPFKFLTTTRLPHLPFEDRYFNLIYAGSVFTHIDDLADAWLMELRRIMKPAGKLYITIQDNHTIQRLNEPKNRQARFQSYMKNDDQLAEAYKNYTKNEYAMFSILRSNAPHTFLETSPNVFYDLEYFINHISTFYRVISVHPNAYGNQTGILLEK